MVKQIILIAVYTCLCAAHSLQCIVMKKSVRAQRGGAPKSLIYTCALHSDGCADKF